ncbi:hypothetical protein Scep_023592 [Stephania cephalantha]|uniref:Uncharacterized protein n=1 Tax=Stephania cephalantha TaxID=152367 RepID=A0AAP0EXW7_9MAGN
MNMKLTKEYTGEGDQDPRGPTRTNERDKRARRVTFEDSSRTRRSDDGGGRYDYRETRQNAHGGGDGARDGEARWWRRGTVKARWWSEDGRGTVERDGGGIGMVYGRWRRDGGRDGGAREKATTRQGRWMQDGGDGDGGRSDDLDEAM